jgi:hypothetical protein
LIEKQKLDIESGNEYQIGMAMLSGIGTVETAGIFIVTLVEYGRYQLQ